MLRMTNRRCTPHLLRRSWGIEPAGTHQEGVGLRFAILHIWIVTQDNVIKDSEELFVLTRLQFERHAGWAGCHCSGDFVLLQMTHKFLHTWWYMRCRISLNVGLIYWFTNLQDNIKTFPALVSAERSSSEKLRNTLLYVGCSVHWLMWQEDRPVNSAEQHFITFLYVIWTKHVTKGWWVVLPTTPRSSLRFYNFNTFWLNCVQRWIPTL